MKAIKRLFWFLYQCFAFYTLLIYMMIMWVPFHGWLAGFMMMSFPAVFLLHLILLPAWYITEKKKALLPLVLVMLGCIFLPRTFGFFGSDDTAEMGDKKAFTVMNYNVHVFQRNAGAWKTEVKKEIRKMKAWMVDQHADILCMPEYFNDDEAPVLNTKDFLMQHGYRYYALHHRKKNGTRKGYWGLGIFSKYPIVAERDTVFEEQNGMIRIDVKIGKDTVRVIGLHLYSMTLQLGALVVQREMDGLKREGQVTFHKMKYGFKQRAREYEALQSWMDQSPYPLIVCGDFNEVPYGYVYGKVRKTLRNSFEEKGSGFGFTYNQLPYFIRIDHQFFDDKRLLLTDFKTISGIRYSDHNPVIGTYTVK